MPSFAAFGLKFFRKYCLGQGISITGKGMQSVAVGWLVWRQTHSVWQVSLVATCTSVAMCLCPLGGMLADRFNRRNLLYISLASALLLAVLLAVYVFTGHFSLWFVLAIAFGDGLVTAVEYPTRQAFNRDMVDDDLIASMIGIYSSIDTAAFLLGQAVGGVVIAKLNGQGEAACFFANAVAYLASFWALSVIPASITAKSLSPRPRAISDASTGASAKANINTNANANTDTSANMTANGSSIAITSSKDCLKFVVSDRAVSVFMLRTAILVLFGTRCAAVLPAYVGQVLNAGPAVNGFLTAAMTCGSIAGILFAGSLGSAVPLLRWSGLALCILPLALIVFACSWTVPIALISYAALYFLIAASNNSCLIGTQLNTPRQLQGRILSWRATLWWGLDLVMTPLVSFVATLIGIRFTFIWAAALCALAAIPTVLFWRARSISETQLNSK